MKTTEPIYDQRGRVLNFSPLRTAKHAVQDNEVLFNNKTNHKPNFNLYSEPKPTLNKDIFGRTVNKALFQRVKTIAIYCASTTYLLCYQVLGVAIIATIAQAL